ncbi:MAG: hypothetical protein WB696_30525, partial [Chthoniobacterales bacterium]
MSVSDLKVIETPKQKAVSRKGAKRRTIVFFIAGAIVCTVIAILSRQLEPTKTPAHQSHAASPAAEMRVSVVHPEKVSSTVNLDLPGQLQAYTDAPIFAQTSGY